MLDRKALVQLLDQSVDSLFQDMRNEVHEVRLLWDALAKDVTLCYRIKAMKHTSLVPTWEGALGKRYTVDQGNVSDYAVIGVDGSQVYPDKHEGVACYLINIGAMYA
ncbi:MAG: hypothetical protein WBQ73_03645, partial [Candidatus Babeliales bacterium]